MPLDPRNNGLSNRSSKSHPRAAYRHRPGPHRQPPRPAVTVPMSLHVHPAALVPSVSPELGHLVDQHLLHPFLDAPPRPPFNSSHSGVDVTGSLVAPLSLAVFLPQFGHLGGYSPPFPISAPSMVPHARLRRPHVADAGHQDRFRPKLPHQPERESRMSKHTSRYSVRLFYSYSHKDSSYRQSIEDSLSILRRNQLLTTWSDVIIVPGRPISSRIRKEMDRADIMVFLLSHNFLASDPCMEEWGIAKVRSATDLLVRIPIILTDCPWPDLLDGDDIKALPNDGHPLDDFDSQPKAWTQIYNGIKSTIVALRSTFSPKPEFYQGISKTPFVGREPLSLRDVFVFPTLSFYSSRKSSSHMTERSLTSRHD